MKKVTYTWTHNLLHLVLFVAFYVLPSIPMLMDISNLTFIQKDCWKEDPIALLLEPGIRTFSDNDIKVIECEAEAISNIYFLEPGGNINPDIFPLLLWCLVTILIFWTIWYYRISIDIKKGTIRVGWKNIDVGLMENIQINNILITSKTVEKFLRKRPSNSDIQFDVEGKHYRIHSDEYTTDGIYWMSEAIMELQKNGKIDKISDSITPENIQVEPEKYIKNTGSFLINTFLILLVIGIILLFIQWQSKL